MRLTQPNDALLETTQSLCPVCLGRVEAAYVARGEEVWFTKECPTHGRFALPVWQGVEEFSRWRGRPGPAQKPIAPARSTAEGCPYDCGLCGAHQQATCCVLLEVTSRCDLGCPVCYASAGADTPDPALETVAGWYDMLLHRGGPFNIQLSGGEPTMRDDLAEVIRIGRQKGFSFFQLNTNGLRIAGQPAYLRQLARAGLNTVFLQFDTLDGETCRRLRGRDVVAEKKRAIINCAAEGLGVVLVPTVRRGCNDEELGKLLAFATSQMPAVRGIHFQPMSYFGRYGSEPSVQDRILIPQLLAAIEAQTQGHLRASDFAPGGAEHPLCSFHADYTVQDGVWTHRKSAGNTGCCGPAAGTSDTARRAVAGKWSVPLDLPGILLDDRYDLSSLDTFITKKAFHTLAVSGMAFQDAWTVDLQRLSRCYIHVVNHAGELVPFCAYNLTAQDGTPLYRVPRL